MASKRYHIVKSDGKVVDPSAISKWLAMQLTIAGNGRWTLQLSKEVEHRSIPQNNLMWMWFACIQDNTDTPAIDVHDYYCGKFLTKVVSVGGREQAVSGGTSTLKKDAMTDFLTKVQADAASELGVQLPMPGDLAYEEFVEMYNGRI